MTGVTMTETEVRDAITAECDTLKQRLLDKNRRYGNSALEPIRIFSKLDRVEQLRIRLDDKLSRLRSGQGDDDEDVTFDLLGYIILLRIALRP